MPAPEPTKATNPTEPAVPAPEAPPAPPAPETVTITREQFEAISNRLKAAESMGAMAEGMKGLQAGAIARAAESEARLKKVEAEVMMRGQQLGRMEKYLAKLIEKELGLKYE